MSCQGAEIQIQNYPLQPRLPPGASTNSPVWRSSEEGCYFIKIEEKEAATFSELDPNSSVPFTSLHNGLEKCKQKVEVKFLQPPRLPGHLDLLPSCSHELRVSRLPSGAQQRWVAAATEAPALESHCPPPRPGMPLPVPRAILRRGRAGRVPGALNGAHLMLQGQTRVAGSHSSSVSSVSYLNNWPLPQAHCTDRETEPQRGKEA